MAFFSTGNRRCPELSSFYTRLSLDFSWSLPMAARSPVEEGWESGYIGPRRFFSLQVRVDGTLVSSAWVIVPQPASACAEPTLLRRATENPRCDCAAISGRQCGERLPGRFKRSIKSTT